MKKAKRLTYLFQRRGVSKRKFVKGKVPFTVTVRDKSVPVASFLKVWGFWAGGDTTAPQNDIEGDFTLHPLKMDDMGVVPLSFVISSCLPDKHQPKVDKRKARREARRNARYIKQGYSWTTKLIIE